MSIDSQAYAEGGNYRATIGPDGVAQVRVWRRPDVSAAVGAAYAIEMSGVFERLTMEPWIRVRGVIFDLTNAPTGFGPVTEAAVSEMFSTMEKAGRWLAVLTGQDALYMMAVGNILKKHAPRCGRLFSSLSNAETWAGQRKRISV